MKVGRISGISFRIHPLFLVLILVYVYRGLVSEVFVVLASVLLHELAHTVVAGRLRLRITEIELFPFGGQAKTEDFLAVNPENEVCVALAGPGTSLALAGLAWVATKWGDPRLFFLFKVNLALGLFNLLPVLPLDGGRVARSVLSLRWGWRKATVVVARLGQLTGLLLCGCGAYASVNSIGGASLSFLGLFLWWAARLESKLVAYGFVRYLVNKKSQLAKKGVMPAHHLVALPSARLKDVIHAVSPAGYTLVVLINEEDRIEGCLTEAELIEAWFEQGPAVVLSDINQR